MSEHMAETGESTVLLRMVNRYAKKLGMKNSHFADASGLPDPNHYTTARDLAILGRALIRDFPEMYKIFAERSYQYSGAPKVKAQPNRNGLLEKDPSVDGIKTGHTSSAGYCLSRLAQRDGRRLISAINGRRDAELVAKPPALPGYSTTASASTKPYRCLLPTNQVNLHSPFGEEPRASSSLLAYCQRYR